MNRARCIRRSVFTAALITLATLIPVSLAQATVSAVGSHVHVKPMGDPRWRPVDLHLFTAPIGTASDGYAEFGTTLAAVLAPPHYQPNPCLGIGPGTPEAPPYDRDIANGLTAAGYLQGHTFTPSQFSAGNGVYLAYMVAPGTSDPAIGSSPDFRRGPIIANALFPIQITGVSERNGTPYDSSLANFTVPALNTLTAPCSAFDVDGSSHFPIFIADNSDFGPAGTPVAGRYRYDLKMLDASGAGWSISARFVVK